jgi:uncharacterized protein GlcG (DUF336 family)
MDIAPSKRLTLAGARKIMAAATKLAADAGIAASVVIVDGGGHLLLAERMEGGRFHTMHSALTKAACAASSRRPTAPQGAQGQPLDAIHAIGLAVAAGSERWTAMEGGCPILIDGECIGAVGVSGGSFEFDASVAQRAASAIAAQ